MEAVRTTAVEELEKYGEDDPILRISVAKKFNIPSWYVPAINKLAQRPEPLDDNDAERLLVLGTHRGVLRFALRLGQVRESLHSSRERQSTHNFSIKIGEVFQCLEDTSLQCYSEVDLGDLRLFIPGPMNIPQECSWDFS
jgi:hypothetical protein